MPLYEVKHRWTGQVLFSLEIGSYQLAVEAAVKAGATLTGATLTGATLRGATLRGADLQPIRDDLWAVLSGAPAEVPALRTALLSGQIDGSTYRGPCACLVGTLAHARGCGIYEFPDVRPDAARPSEQWFWSIRPGDTPGNSAVAAQALAWIETWLHNMHAAFGAPQESSHA